MVKLQWLLLPLVFRFTHLKLIWKYLSKRLKLLVSSVNLHQNSTATVRYQVSGYRHQLDINMHDINFERRIEFSVSDILASY